MKTDAYPAEHQIIIGRDREREQLRALLTRAINGQGSLALVSGEAGIGKTTLVTDLTRQARAQGALVLTGGCYDLTTTPPYGPWVEITRSYPASDDSLPQLPEQLRQSGALTSIRSQTELFELVSGFFAAVSTHQPLVLVLEDLHWSDPASLDLLRYLGRSLATSAVLFLVTYRDDELTRRHPLFQLLPVLSRETGATRLELRRFSSDQTREMVAARGLSAPDATRLAAYLDQRTSGNPLLATELLRALESEGTLNVTQEGARLGELDDDFLPSFVLQIIERRLAPLDPETRRPLEIAAVIGQEVPLEIWQAVSELDQMTLDAAIEQALAAHILEETPGRQGLRFTHALIREVLYDGVIPTRRRVWHRSTADALIASSDPDPDAVAHHLEQAGDPRLVDWLIRAGERAERRWAELMAAEQFDRAQLLLEGNPDRAAERAWLLFRTGLLLRHGDHPRSLQHLEDAEAVALIANRPVIAHLARAHQGNVSMFLHDPRRGIDDLRTGILALEQLDAARRDELERLTSSLGTNLAVQGRGTLGMHLANAGRYREARALLDDWPESEWEIAPDAFIGAGLVYAIQGQPRQARQAFARAQSMYEALNDPGMAGSVVHSILIHVQLPYAADDVEDRRQLIRSANALMIRDTGVAAPEHQADTLWAYECFLSGDWAQAEDLLHRSTYWGHDFYSTWRLQLARHRGDAATGWDTIRRVLPDGPASEPGMRAYVLFSELQPLAVKLALDAVDLPIARQWLDANDQLLDWSGAVLGRSENQRLWARYHLLDGDPAAARRHASHALEHASDPRQPLALLASHRFLGHLDTLDGHFDDAETHLQTSLDLTAACQAPFERALTLLELARLRGAQGQTEEAQQWLAEVRTICEPLRAQPTLEQVAALEAELTDRPAMTPFGLTPRELDVLRFVAEGLTDPEVAERLFVSPRTVSSHLTSVYTKLGVSSRTAATRLAVEHGLL